MTTPALNRRPLKTRQARWAGVTAQWLARRGVKPNTISLASMGFAFVSGAALIAFPYCHENLGRAALLITAAAGIQLRLLCNLLDGMVAIEGGHKTATGEIYNDLPDRISDVLILVPLGFAVPFSWGAALGWASAALALLTAYVRVLGGSMGTAHYFIGPMAKQQRMALVTVVLLGSVVELYLGWHGWLITGALLVLILGSSVTVVRRLRRITGELRSR